MAGNAVIGQSGGPTAVINQSAVGVVEGLQAAGFTGQILGARHAVAGIKADDFIDLGALPQDRLDRLADTPSSGLGSSRDKPDADYCEQILDHLKKRDVRYFFYIGGNDSSDTCRIVAEMAKDSGYELHAVHCPKTVDNDLMVNDHTPGYGSAAKFVAQAFMGDNLDNAALPGIKVDVVMGRHAGFLTAASMLGRREGTTDGPHLVYVPEVAFDFDQFCADVEETYRRLGRCLIAVSEGIHDATGAPVASVLAEKAGQAIEKDAHGNVQLSGTGALGDALATAVKNYFAQKSGASEKVRVRADTFGYLQRSFVGCASPVDQREARASSRAAARAALDGAESGSIAIVRTSTPGPGENYAVDYKLVPVIDIAAKTKHLPTSYVTGDNNITEDFKHYALPLVGPLPVIETL